MMKHCTADKYSQLSLKNMKYVYITSPQMEQLHVNSLSYNKKENFHQELENLENKVQRHYVFYVASLQ